MENKKLHSTDYVIYNNITNEFIRWHSNYDIVIYGNKEEAILDCRESEGWEIVSCTNLPEELQQEIIYQLNK